MGLRVRIEEDLKEAMRGKDIFKMSALRMLISALKNAEIEAKGELGEDKVIAVLAKQAKQREDSIAQFEGAKRLDLADKEEQELVVIESYLPKKMTDQEVALIVEKVIAETQASSSRDMGTVIKQVLKVTAGQADGGTISRIVKEKLQ